MFVNDVDSVTIDYSNLDPLADFTFVNSSFDVDFTNLSQHGISYTWDFGDGDSSTEENPTHTYTTTGIYSVVLIATKCNLEHQITIDVNVGGLGLTNNNKSNFRIFPNPSNGKVNITTTDLKSQIVVFNLQGSGNKKFYS